MITFRTEIDEDGTKNISMINPNAIVMVHETTNDAGTIYTLTLVDGSRIVLTEEEFKPIGDSF